MSPEQAEGRLDQLGPATDIFGLGATLYAILTGRPPYQGDLCQMMIQAALAEYPPPRQLKPGVPLALEAICLKAMASRPAERYATALALTADVEHWLADEPVAAYREPLRARLGRWARRHPAHVAAAGAALLVALLAGGAAWVWTTERRAETERAVGLALGKAEQLREQARKVRSENPGGAAEALAVWKQALAAAEQAEDIGAAGLAGAETAARAARLLAELRAGVNQAEQVLAQARKDARMLAALEAARMARSVGKGQSMDFAAGAEAYARAFAAYGVDVRANQPTAAVPALRRLPAHMRETLVVALEDWAMGEPSKAVRERLRKVAGAVDEDPWRRRFRRARDLAALKGLAAAARHKPLPAVSIDHLVYALTQAGARAEAEALLREAQRRYPADFWINFELAVTLWNAEPRSKQGLEEAIGYYRAAVALRPGSAPVHINLGVALKAKGDVAGAIAEYKRAIALDPKDALAHSNLGLALQAQGDVAEAIAAYRKATALDPKDAPAHNNLGLALQAQGNVAGAIAAYRKAIALEPKSAPAHSNLGYALQAQGDVAGAIAAYRKATALDPKSAPAHSNLGNGLQAQGDVAGAIAAYKRAIALDPKLALARTDLGLALQAQADMAGAIAAYRKATALDPKSALAHVNLGDGLQAQGDVAGAIAAYRKAIALEPKGATKAHNKLGVLLNDRLKDHKAAATCFRRAIALDPKYAPAHSNLGKALEGQGDVAGAIAEFKKAIALDPKYAIAHTGLGATLAQQGDVAGAIVEFKKAIALDPKDAPAHANLGNTLMAQGDVAGAIAAYRKAIALDPNLAPAHNNLGLALKAQGDVAGAIAAYRKAIALDPKDTIAHTGLGATLAQQGDVAGAIVEFKKAIALEPKSALAHVNLGDGLHAQGDVAGAIAAYRKAIALDPKSAPAHANLGTALQEKGDVAGAIAAYRKAIALDPTSAETHCSLGLALREQGRLQESLASLRRGHSLGARRRGWPYPSAQWLKQAERLVELDQQLPAFLKGGRQPRNAAEARDLAELCQQPYKQRYAATVRFYRVAFAAEPKRAEALDTQDRYYAACAAALAGCGQGKDAAPLDAKERSRLRRQALAWLRADFTAWQDLLPKASKQARSALCQTLRHWQKDTDLAGVRDKVALAKLPEAERQQWAKLWADVAALLVKAGPKK
jgi:tetratricopeptide (TPR) repeat protein